MMRAGGGLAALTLIRAGGSPLNHRWDPHPGWQPYIPLDSTSVIDRIYGFPYSIFRRNELEFTCGCSDTFSYIIIPRFLTLTR